jgi:RNA polymerase sigma-70 factor (ECF subfamily)
METTKFNKSQILKKAWQLFRIMVAKDESNRTDKMFSDCLIVSWAIAKTIPCIDINELYKKYYSPILNFIMQMLHNSNDAEELTNDTFIKAMQNMEKFNSEKSNISTWLHTIAKRLVIDFVRKDESDKYINVGDFVDESGKEIFQFEDKRNNSEENLENKELLEAVQKAMSQLKPKYQKIATMFFIEDKPYPEIAEALQMPVGSVKGMVFRIKAMLRGELQFVYQKSA